MAIIGFYVRRQTIRREIYIGVVIILYFFQDCEMCNLKLEGRILEGEIYRNFRVLYFDQDCEICTLKIFFICMRW
jgi:hypothetical protein